MARTHSLFMAGLLAPLAISACVYVDEGSAPVREVVVEREVLVDLCFCWHLWLLDDPGLPELLNFITLLRYLPILDCYNVLANQFPF